MLDLDDHNGQFAVLYFGDDAIVADAKAPIALPLDALQRFAELAWISRSCQPFFQKSLNSPRDRFVEAFQLSNGVRRELNCPGQAAH